MVAARTLDPGDELTDKSVKWEAWPDKQVYDGLVTRKIGEEHPVTGKMKRAVVPGEPVTESAMVSDKDATLLARGRFGLMLHAIGENDETLPSSVPGEVAPGHQSTVLVPLTAHRRGWLELPRLRIDTTYPLGLFRAWAYWRASQQVLVWPALDPHAPPLPDSDADGGSRSAAASRPVDTPDGLRPWRRGDTLRAIAWKKSATRLASGQAPVSREASLRPHQECWVEWDQAQGLPLEARLSRLASWLVMAEQRALDLSQPYGLRLPDRDLGPAHGPQHLQQCLDALATWGAA